MRRSNAFPSEDENNAESEDCDGMSGFPCWPCVGTGRKELPNYPSLQLFIHGMSSDDLG
ncbi:hypothetical protein [Haladaptatus litoreus]|uniref:hypothetical protein n=1 Tax=Haladaptatus litoreus TaxID=553468 RepID=UPI001FED01AD|nr:hypothetical protein [Haladaptatus litoreus]